MNSKEILSKEIEEQTKEFLKKNRIEKIPVGVSKDTYTLTEKQKKKPKK